MSTKKRKKIAVVELDRTQLLIVVLLTFFLCGISFFFGRWSRDEVRSSFRSELMLPADSKQDNEEYNFYEVTTESEESDAADVGLQTRPRPPSNRLPLREATGSPTNSRSYAIQLLATADYEKAQSLTSALKKEDYPAFLMTTDRPGRSSLYRVRVGLYHSKTLTQDIAEDLRAKGHSTWIVTESPQARTPTQPQH